MYDSDGDGYEVLVYYSAGGRKDRFILSRRQSFTLIELLVVFAIIGILAAILLLTLFRAKSVTHKAACISNQRQIGIARQLYANDNDDFLIPFRLSELWSVALCAWYSGGDTNLFDCPAEKRILCLVVMGKVPYLRFSWGWDIFKVLLGLEGGLEESLVGIWKVRVFGILRWFRLLA